MKHFPKVSFVTAAAMVIIFSIGFYFAKDSIPGDPLYFAKHDLQMIQLKTVTSESKRAELRLSTIEDFVKRFDIIAHKNPKDSHLIPIADEIIYESSAVTLELDRMKQQKESVKKEAVVLCEALEKQTLILRFLSGLADPNMQSDLQRISKITDRYTSEAMKWEGEK